MLAIPAAELIRQKEFRALNLGDIDDDETLGLDEDDSDDYGVNERSGRRRRSDQTEARRERRRRRANNGQTSLFTEIGSDDEEMLQDLSTNKTPKGLFVNDYNVIGHMWRLPSSSSKVQRQWLRRFENDSPYNGSRVYCPQVGDSVVYVPRAHWEVLQDFPSLPPPWQKWPRGRDWPVVRCSIRAARYRFPYQDYFSKAKK